MKVTPKIITKARKRSNLYKSVWFLAAEEVGSRLKKITTVGFLLLVNLNCATIFRSFSNLPNRFPDPTFPH